MSDVLVAGGLGSRSCSKSQLACSVLRFMQALTGS